MDREIIEQVVAFMQETDLQELVWEQNGERVAVRRRVDRVVPPPALSGCGDEPATDDAAAANDNGRLVTVCSPMVGTFYRSLSSDRPPFVVAGSAVAPGRKLGVIEAMKVMRDVVATAKGKISEILVESGHPVEYGQTLFVIDTEGN